MASFNKIVIVGYLGKDSEIRYLPDGAAIANFSVASTERRKDRNGDTQDQTTWFRVSLFGKIAETLGEYLVKGRQVYVEGRLSQQEFTDREGNKRTSLEVRASEVQLLGERSPQGESRQRDELDGAQAYARRQAATRTATEEDDLLIPF